MTQKLTSDSSLPKVILYFTLSVADSLEKAIMFRFKTNVL